jgi:acyl carrier protein
VLHNDKISEKLLEVFKTVLEEPNFEYIPTTSMGSLESWDSFAQINLIIEIESTFEIEFDSEEIGILLSVEAIEGAVRLKLKEFK